MFYKTNRTKYLLGCPKYSNQVIMRLLLSFFLSLIALTAFAQSASDVNNYLTFFNNQHIAVNNAAMAYLQFSVHSEDLNLIQEKRQNVVSQLNNSIELIQKAPAFEQEDNSLKAEALNVFNSLLSSFSENPTELLQLKMQSQNSYEAMEKYFEAQKASEKKMEIASERYLGAQKAFAEKYNVQLVEAADNNDIKDLNQLNNYHQAIFLRYFKVTVRNNDFMEALNGQNFEQAQQALNQLAEDSGAERKSLNAMPDFKQDSTYRMAAVELVEAIDDLANEGYKTMLDLMQKAPTERTQTDVDTFNEVATQFQTIIPQLNQKAMEAGNELLKKYVPKPRATKRL